MRTMLPTLSAATLALLLAGCSLAPHYQRPALPVAESLPGVTANTAKPQAVTLDAVSTGWRGYFSDPSLQQLISSALANNRDLRQAALAVESYQAQYRIQQAGQWPNLNAGAVGTKQRAFSSGSYRTAENYTATLAVTAFELDFFQRVQNLSENALQQYLAMAATQRSAAISLIAEIARAYLTLIADQEKLAITEETLRNEEEFYHLTDLRAQEGLASQLTLAQARTVLETARANRAMLQRQVAQDRHALQLLVGGSLPALPEKAVLLEQKLPALERPLSSQQLLQRPDIIAAEHELQGAYASIGAARAAFFPSISLTASGGVASNELSKLFDGSSGVWLFSPSINLPVFNAGRLAAQLDVAELRRDSAIAKYEKAIQSAFREVADALVGLDTYAIQLTAQENTVAAAQDYYLLASNRHQEGLDSYLTLLDAQRSLYAARQNLVALRLAQASNQINLYKALGGGQQE